MTETGWIKVNRWRDFQHYGDRRPVWIKAYTRLLDDANYLDLSASERGLLHTLWLMTARAGLGQIRIVWAPAKPRGCPRLTPAMPSTNPEKVRNSQICSIVEAGFITILASKPASETLEQSKRESTRRDKPSLYKESGASDSGESRRSQEGTNGHTPRPRKVPKLVAQCRRLYDNDIRSGETPAAARYALIGTFSEAIVNQAIPQEEAHA